MSGFNFGQIENIVSQYMDTDYIDIRRDVAGVLQEIYSNVPCHIQIVSVDNPNPQTVDIKPIIQSLNVHMNQYVDIRNNDFIVAKKIDGNGNLLISYSGRCGEPAVEQGRKKVSMQMNSTSSEIPTPVPPVNPITITLTYISSEQKIQNDVLISVERNSVYTVSAPVIEGFSAVKIILDDVEVEGTSVSFNVGEMNHSIEFIYDISSKPEIFRILTNGLYTKDNGELANGFHFYKKIKINEFSVQDDVYTISCNSFSVYHEDNSSLITLNEGTKLILIPGNIFLKVDSIISNINNITTFTATSFIPTSEEKNAYVTGWYD